MASNTRNNLPSSRCRHVTGTNWPRALLPLPLDAHPPLPPHCGAAARHLTSPRTLPGWAPGGGTTFLFSLPHAGSSMGSVNHHPVSLAGLPPLLRRGSPISDLTAFRRFRATRAPPPPPPPPSQQELQDHCRGQSYLPSTASKAGILKQLKMRVKKQSSTEESEDSSMWIQESLIITKASCWCSSAMREWFSHCYSVPFAYSTGKPFPTFRCRWRLIKIS